MKIVRVTRESERAGAYYVRIQAMMRKHQIPLDAEIDSRDGAGCHYLPEYRGQHLGRSVVAEAEKWMREAGFRKVEISSRVNVADFYEKMGYRFNESGKAHHDTFECVYMEKVL